MLERRTAGWYARNLNILPVSQLCDVSNILDARLQGQIVGRKLFVLFPPDCGGLYKLDSEKETEQSPLDPLHPDLTRYPEYANARPLSCIVYPGQALLVPKGWWHYAVALDRSITVQRNFYHASSNAAGLVKMVLKTAAALKQATR
jgi:hypothetical protein